MKQLMLGAGAGLILALALPGLGWWPLVLVFPALFLSALQSTSRWRAFWLGWWSGIVHWAVATFWVVDVMHGFGGLPLPVAIICLILMGAIVGSSWALVAVLVVSVRPVCRVWMLPLAWALVEAARQWPPYVFPWNSTAAALAGYPSLLGSLPVWGATGLSWLIVALGTGLWGLRCKASRPTAAVALSVSLLLAVAMSLVAPEPVATGEPFQVLLVQPGTTQNERWNPTMFAEVAERVWRLSRGAENVDLVLWPEGAVPWVLETNPRYLSDVMLLASELDAAVLLNSVGPLDEGYANSAYLVDGKGIQGQRYDKVRLVPFGEYVPSWARLAFAEAMVREVASFTAGRRPVLLDAGTPVGVAICYEIIFPDLVAAQVRAGATVLTTLTNDGWYGFSWAPPQHFAQAVLRAAEMRRPVVRAALTGISGIIDPTGRVIEALPVGADGVVQGQVQPTTGLTPRARFGDWWALLSAVGVVAVLVISRRRTNESATIRDPRE